MDSRLLICNSRGVKLDGVGTSNKEATARCGQSPLSYRSANDRKINSYLLKRSFNLANIS